MFWEKFVKFKTNFENFIENFEFKKIFNKILKINENLNFSYYLGSLLVKEWAVLYSCQFFDFGGGGNVPPVLPATPQHI